MKRDVSTREDVETVVRGLYDGLMGNEITAPKFSHIHIEGHLPTIYNFWCFILQIEPEKYPYRGGVFGPHVKLNLEEKHFDLWLGFLKAALEKFEGPVATKWMAKAEEQAMFFKYKLGITDFKIDILKKD